MQWALDDRQDEALSLEALAMNNQFMPLLKISGTNNAMGIR